MSTLGGFLTPAFLLDAGWAGLAKVIEWTCEDNAAPAYGTLTAQIPEQAKVNGQVLFPEHDVGDVVVWRLEVPSHDDDPADFTRNRFTFRREVAEWRSLGER